MNEVRDELFLCSIDVHYLEISEVGFQQFVDIIAKVDLELFVKCVRSENVALLNGPRFEDGGGGLSDQPLAGIIAGNYSHAQREKPVAIEDVQSST